MEKKYISESRYKKSINKKRRDVKTVKEKTKNINNHAVKEKSKTSSKPKKLNRRKKSNTKLKNIIICIILLILIAVISRAILKDENEPFIPISFLQDKNEDEIMIGIITTSDFTNESINNLVINELDNYSKDMLVTINADYTINYLALENVLKVTNKEYLLKISDKYLDSINDIKNKIEEYANDKDSNYYSKLNNVNEIKIEDNSLRVVLKNDDPYFIYKLNVPVLSGENTSYVISSLTKDKIIYERNDKADIKLPLKLVLKRYNTMYDAAQAYKKEEIDLFITNSDNAKNMLGKFEYNISTFRNGETTFVFFNNNSELIKKDEIRKAIVYGIDRDGIIKDIFNNNKDKIDLPYIYDNVKYKYDVYAAENILLTNGYKKVNNVYTNEENKINLTLIVNDTENNVKVANKIKNNLATIGININVEKLTSNNIKRRLNTNDYDLVIASVALNDTPDIIFALSNLYINEEITKSIDKVNNSSIIDLPLNIKALQNELSDNYSCLGICANTSYIIYSKRIIGLENVSFLKLFDTFLK